MKKSKKKSSKKSVQPSLVIALFGILILFLITVFLSEFLRNKYSNRNVDAQTISQQIYWGATIDAATVGSTCGNAPWCIDGKDQSGNPATDSVTIFENHAGKKISIFNWGGSWFRSTSWPYNNYVPFDTTNFEKVRQHGSLSMYTWSPNDGDLGSNNNQPNFTLNRIINGARYGANCDITVDSSCKTYDAYLTQWATAAKNWGNPFFLRFAWEMNGGWYLWSEQKNGNAAGDYVNAWRHVHDIFAQVGATNVTWVWCPNVEFSGSQALEGLYPGDSYVDWTCMDGYNFGTDPAKPDSWKTFSQVFTPTYNHLLQIAPSKPIIIAETASTEIGGTKSDWVTDMLTSQLPVNFPKIKAFLWFNWNFKESGGTIKYSIESSQTAQDAFNAGIASPYYAANTFGSLPKLTPVQPIASTVSPTATPTAMLEPTATNTPIPTSTIAVPTSTPIPTFTSTPTPTRTPTPFQDIVAPSLTITNPLNNSTIKKGRATTITATASDNVGVTKVSFMVGSTLLCTDTEASYSCNWNVPSKTGAIYVITVKAYDAVGNITTRTSTVKAVN